MIKKIGVLAFNILRLVGIVVGLFLLLGWENERFKN